MGVNIKFYESGNETDSRVKYSGRSFEIAAEGENIAYASLNLRSYDGEQWNFEMCKSGDAFRMGIPELAPGLYFFNVEGIDGSSPFCTEEDRLSSVANRYPETEVPDGIIYHIFVDRFARGGYVLKRNDTVYHENWNDDIMQYAEKQGDDVENNEFFGGTLYGVAEKLDYIKSLGTKWIYLSPVFTAYSNHKYDTSDFLSVDMMFGSRNALVTLIKKCHENGIKLILDGVFNHVGRDSVYFLSALDGVKPYVDWFTIRQDGTYECWWGLTNLPKINKIESYRKFICDKVIPEYMKLGIDGWRLDVVDEYDDRFLSEITASVKKYNKNAVVIGEVWDEVTTKVAYGEHRKYFFGSELDSVMNYPLRNGIIEYIRTGNANLLSETLDDIVTHYPKEKLNVLMNILGTHDTERIITVLGSGFSGERTGSELARTFLSAEEREKGKRLTACAYKMLVCMPGIPTVFYGDEAGLEGWRDPFNRRTFPWGKEDAELTEIYREAGKLREKYISLRNGNTEIVQTNDGFFVFDRQYGEETVRCVCNMSESYDYFVPDCWIPITDIENGNIVYPKSVGIYLKRGCRYDKC